MFRSTCLGQDLSIRKCEYRSYIAPFPVKLCKAVGLFPRGSFKSKSTYKRGVAFSPPSNELQGAFGVNTWEFLTTYSQRKRGEVDKIICCLFTLRHFLFFVLVIVANYCPWHTRSKQWETSVRAGIFLKRAPRHRHLPPAQARANLDTSHWHPKAHSAVSRKVSTSLHSYRSYHLTC